MSGTEGAAGPAHAEGAETVTAEGVTAAAESTPGENAAAEATPARDGANPRPARSAWDDPRLPWSGKPRAADVACWAGITLSGLYYLLLLPFRADLVGTHPVVSVLLNGSTESIVAAAAFARVGHGTLAVVLLAALVGLMLFDALYWWAGRLWGERFILLLSGRKKRGPRYMARVERWGRRFTWPAIVVSRFLPIPSAIIYVISGWAGMRLVTFLILDAISSLLWAGMLAGLGYALGHHAVVVAHTISHYGLWFTLAIVALIIAGQVRSQRAHRGEAEAAGSGDRSGAPGETSAGEALAPAGDSGPAEPAAGPGEAAGPAEATG